jgi:preprotein translocase subunit SecE
MKNVGTFLKEVRAEMARVEWPKTDEWLGATVVTLILVAFFTVYLGIIDRVIQWLIYNQIFSHVRR